MTRLPIVAALAAASFSLAASAAVYRWVDAEGHVHYTDRAVPNSEPVDIHTGQPKEASDAPSVDPNLPADQVALKKSECEQKKKQYASYKGASKIVETDSLGRKHEYTEDEMKMLISKTQEAMQQACGAAGISTATTAPPSGSTSASETPKP